MRSFFSIVTPLALCTTLLLTTVGCESQPKASGPVSVDAIRADMTPELDDPVSVDVDDIRDDMTPELMSTGKTWGQAQNNNARITDNNTRGIWDDLSRFMFLDRTSGLTPYPTP